MAAKDDAPREIPNLAGQESSRPERAAAQLCQLKMRYEFSQQSSSSPHTMPAANSKRRLEASASPFPSGPCSPSVEALLAATVSRVESVVANEMASTTTKLPEKKSSAAQVVTTPVSSKCRSRDIASPMTPKRQENNAKVVCPLPDDSTNVQAVGSSPSNGNVSKATTASDDGVTSTSVICKLTSNPNSASPSTPKTLAKQAKAAFQGTQPQTPDSTGSSQNGIRIVQGITLKTPIIYVDDYMNSGLSVVKNGESSKAGSSPVGCKPKASTIDDQEQRTSRSAELETTPNITRSLKRLSEEDMVDGTPKKQPALIVRKKELDCPVLSPVMRDSIDSPGSPMTRSMSRRIEENTIGAGDSSHCKSVIPVNVTCGSASSSENEESTLSLQHKPFLQKKVQFSKVSLYLFEREQGFTSVPSEGGSTLGMGAQHLELQEYSIEEYAQIRRSQMSLSTGATLPHGQDVEGLIVQPLPTRRRRELLRQSGVRNIDALEKEELQMIRVSRQQCGCSCVGQCLPGSCLCLEQGIECQVDHGFYPCGCTVEGCSNPLGRHEFNRRKVKMHVKATCAKANRELGLPEILEDIITAADSPDNFGSQEEVYSSSECSENSDYSSPEDTLIEEPETISDPNAEGVSNGFNLKQSLCEPPVAEESDKTAKHAAGTSMS